MATYYIYVLKRVYGVQRSFAVFGSSCAPDCMLYTLALVHAHRLHLKYSIDVLSLFYAAHHASVEKSASFTTGGVLYARAQRNQSGGTLSHTMMF